MNALEELLSTRYIIKEKNKELYFKIKDEIPRFKKFAQEKLGYSIIIKQNLIKLEKVPGVAQPFMGIQEFSSALEYCMLCLVLMFLEDKNAGEQYVLSQLTEYMQLNSPTELDWTIYSNRRSFIRVMRFCRQQYFFSTTDGEDENFVRDLTAEVLYEATGISRYFARSFTQDIMDFNSITDFENSEWIDMDQDRGIIRRQRVYRKLLLSPIVCKNADEDEDFAYIKNIRSVIAKDMEEFLECELHVHKSCSLLIAPENSKLGRTYPENSTASDITTLFFSLLQEQIKNGDITLPFDEIIKMDKDKFIQLICLCKDKHSEYWSKSYREMTDKELSRDILEYMLGLGFISVGNDQPISIYPVAGKIAGEYSTPSDSQKSTRKSTRK